MPASVLGEGAKALPISTRIPTHLQMQKHTVTPPQQDLQWSPWWAKGLIAAESSRIYFQGEGGESVEDMNSACDQLDIRQLLAMASRLRDSAELFQSDEMRPANDPKERAPIRVRMLNDVLRGLEQNFLVHQAPPGFYSMTLCSGIVAVLVPEHERHKMELRAGLHYGEIDAAAIDAAGFNLAGLVKTR
ncbi:Inactive N-acetylated-alpha-linked acidic dipeptidase-like protein 2 [Chelonia mydas]|uniref:Inactive N-acetylated-alpha-linked acidic dipeptidase-like protein 2 n=1 Tax=Chelonia mydas TaxID=8469 RepID=M7BME2_CHEMY|nr:Inactive N-acetylated-alpha-linked acidic dipeptidase-like protein 2 [Chelonia mydas]